MGFKSLYKIHFAPAPPKRRKEGKNHAHFRKATCLGRMFKTLDYILTILIEYISFGHDLVNLFSKTEMEMERTDA